MQKYRLAAEWESYRKEVLPRNVSTTQLWECRRAFYSGAASMHSVMMASLSPGGDVTSDDLSAMEEVMAELMAFNERVKAGTA